VGGLSTGYLGNERPRPNAGAGGSALLSAVGAWLVGTEAAICAVVAPDFPADQIRIIMRAGIDLSRVRLATPDELSSDELEPSADQLASVSPNWAVHLCGLSTRRQAAIIHRLNQRVALLTLDTIYIPARLEPERKDVLALAAQFPIKASAEARGGDAYAGAFAATFMIDRDLARSMAWGAAAASVVMESSVVLDVLSEYGRKKTESRARSLLSELRQGT
jgi:hypothetical protein